MKKSFAVKGHLCYSITKDAFKIVENGYLVCRSGYVEGVYERLSEEMSDLEVLDFGDRIIIPGLTDLHLHAPQYSFRSLGMDMELMEWLNTHTFPEEAKYADMDYAQRAYSIFADDLKFSATTRAVIFATLHVPATRLLMDKLDATGIKAYVGKVNMDRNCPEYLCEKDSAAAEANTRRWLEECMDAYENIRPILTPRFTPACSDDLMRRLGEMQRSYGLPVQSHLSENPGEIDFVSELCPDCATYGETYDRFGLFGTGGPAIMAHCVYSSEAEARRMKDNGVFVAHCPQSNMNLASGIAPARKYMEMGLNMGLGSDIAGGCSLSILRAMADAVGMSKMYWRLVDNTAKPLSTAEAFYLGTKGGGAFFGKCGSFEPGYAADIVVLEDSGLPHPQPLDVASRLERVIYLADSMQPYAKFVAGERIF